MIKKPIKSLKKSKKVINNGEKRLKNTKTSN